MCQDAPIAPPRPPILTRRSTLGDACALLCGVAEEQDDCSEDTSMTHMMMCDAAYVVDDPHHRRLLGVVSVSTLLRFLQRGAPGQALDVPMDTAVRHSFVTRAAPEPLSPRAARATTATELDPALRVGAANDDTKASSATQSSKKPLSPRRHTVSPYDGASLAELERQVHMKRKQSFRRKFRGKKVSFFFIYYLNKKFFKKNQL